MLTRRLFAVLLGVLTITGLAYAFRDLILIRDMDNVVAQRLPGAWMIDAETSRALDPDRYSAAITSIEFREDASVLTRLREFSDRFETRQVYMAGLVIINRAEPVPFVISTDSGNPVLTWFTPSEEGVLGNYNSVYVCMVCSRGMRGDWLALGGDAGGLPAAIYRRTK
jgi:hypothetical protein